MKIFTALECVADDRIEDGRPARWWLWPVQFPNF